MKKVGLICLVLCLVLAVQSLTMPVLAVEDAQNKAVVSGSHSLDGAIPMLGNDKLIDNISTAVVYEVSTQTLMYAWNADERIYPASFVKIMTALIAAEQGNMSDAVTVTAEVLDTVPYYAMSSDLQADEVLTLEDLLYCMMVDSCNDAAAVIADHISGSQQAFVAQMNQYAKELGCTGTNFTNVHGLHDEAQYTTARDTARILTAALENELFRTVFSTVYYTVPATNKSEARELATGNFLMNDDTVEIYYDTRITGGRTGETESGHRCIASTAESDGMQMICIVAGSASELAENGYSIKKYGGYKETSNLLDKAFSGYAPKQILFGDQALKQYSVVNGDADVVVGPRTPVSTVLPENITQSELSYRYSDVYGSIAAPVENGQKLSAVEVWYGNICVAQADLYAMNKVPVQQLQTNTQPAEDDANALPAVLIVLGILLAVIIVFVLGSGFSRSMRKAAARNRSRRYRKNRRRSR